MKAASNTVVACRSQAADSIKCRVFLSRLGVGCVKTAKKLKTSEFPNRFPCRKLETALWQCCVALQFSFLQSSLQVARVECPVPHARAEVRCPFCAGSASAGPLRSTVNSSAQLLMVLSGTAKAMSQRPDINFIPWRRRSWLEFRVQSDT